MKRDARLIRLTINFALFALLAACLIGIGQRSRNMPMLMAICLALSLSMTDYFRYIELPRLLAYITMLAGAITAIGEFFFIGQIDQLTAVAKLLIYVQIGLMFQRKDRRVFEQWGIFLLLELIVASLVNDNLLYGLLLIPVLVMGCSTLLAYASYVSNTGSGSVGTESNSVFARLMRWFGREHLLKSHSNSISMQLSNSADHQFDMLGDSRVGYRRVTSLVFGILIFSIAFFYLMPRLQSGSYEGAGWNQAAVGFSGEVSLKDVGTLLETNAVALKVSFRTQGTEEPYQPIEPPYIRGSLCHIYVGQGVWRTLEANVYQSELLAKTPFQTAIIDSLAEADEHLEVIVDEQTPFERATFSIPPLARSGDRTTPSEVLAYDWRLIDPSNNRSKKSKYSFETYGITKSKSSRVLPIYSDCIKPELLNSTAVSAATFHYDTLTQFSVKDYPGLIALRDKILKDTDPSNIANQVLILEDYLVSSSEFRYSLAPSPDRRLGVDPIEDFAANHKTGHCQYFASTMTMMLRSMGIPARIVLGFRPSDYNQIGNYFLVRQRHAHAWVEAYLPRQAMVEAGLDVPTCVTRSGWLRLDPTPAGEGSNAGGSIRSSQGGLESLQQFWQEYVMNVDRSNQSQALRLFDSQGSGGYTQILRNIERAILGLQSNRLVGGLLSPDQWFSWQAAALLSIAIAAIAMSYKLVTFALSLWSRNSKSQQRLRSQRLVQASFYRRILKALGKLNLKRLSTQTPLEFATNVQAYFEQHPTKFPNASAEIAYLTSIYHRLRYGFDEDLQFHDWQRIEASTKNIESAVNDALKQKRQRNTSS